MTVYLVEDEAISCRGMVSILKALRPNWIVRAFPNGREAIEHVHAEPCELLLTDIKMPVMDGFELIEQIHLLYPKCVCVILSVCDDFATMQRALRLGVYDFLLKPVDEEGLLDMLERVEPKLTQRSKANCNNNFAGQVSKYITKNLANPDLSLTMIAEKFHFTTNYLSTWFRANMGENFLRYVTRLRLEKACMLLQEGLRVYETAERVGYTDPKYFIKVFKQSFGVTPDVFRRLNEESK